MRQFIESLEGRTLFAITLPDAPTVYALTETTLSVPRTPTLNAVSSTSELATTLAWSNVIGETGYEIQRARNGGGFYFLVRTAKNATSYTDKEKLLYDTSYSYQVKAIADGPDSLWSNSASVRTIKNPVIQTITDLRGTYNTATGKVDLLYTFDPTANPYVVLKDGAVVKNADGSNYTDMNGDAHVAQAQGTNATYQVRDAQGDVSNVIEIKLGAVPNEPPPDPDPIPDPDPTPDPVPVEGAHRTTDPVIAPTITRTVVLKDSDSITVARSAIAVAGTKVTLAPFKVYELGSPLAMGNDTELDLNGATLKVTGNVSAVFQNDDKVRAVIGNGVIATKVNAERGIEIQGEHVRIHHVKFDGQTPGSSAIFTKCIDLSTQSKYVTITDIDQPDVQHYFLWAGYTAPSTAGRGLTLRRIKVGYHSAALESHTIRGGWSDVLIEDCDIWNVKGRTALTWKMGTDISVINTRLIGPTGFGPLADSAEFRTIPGYLLTGLRIIGCEWTRNTSFERGVVGVQLKRNYGRISDPKVIRLDTRSGTEDTYIKRGVPSGDIIDNHWTGPDDLRMFSGNTEDAYNLKLTGNTLNAKAA